MPKITLNFTDYEFDAFIAANPQFIDVFRKRTKIASMPKKTKLDQAKEIILDSLNDGIDSYTAIADTASLFGVRHATLYRAKVELGIVSTVKHKEGGGRVSTWRLPK